ncbi:MAG: helix-turn-helix transcriptional regulator [Bacteroidota bacterium]|nr:helix-turn-helix transcriptional regulator [Bacteroidota bacterium]MDP4226430.1 helix-turn-helix transcriptional regulator [Bacteroidota bacterium]MDP4274241.1 helix-turn-helix transcriptional regulator [Bacteroidota bacterium]
MNMKFKDKYKISSEFENLFTFKSEEEELEHEAKMIMFRFLSELENINDSGKPLKKKDLAKKLGVSASFISQLFNGDKLLNFNLLAKIQKIFNLTFEIKAQSNDYQSYIKKYTVDSFLHEPAENAVWVWHNLKKPDYHLKDQYFDSTDIGSNENNNVTAA